MSRPRRTLTIEAPPELVKAAKRRALEEDTTLSEEIRSHMRQFAGEPAAKAHNPITRPDGSIVWPPLIKTRKTWDIDSSARAIEAGRE